MIFKFEEWLQQEREIDSDSKDLHKESILCFRAGAYHAAFLICMLAMKKSAWFLLIKNQNNPRLLKVLGEIKP